MTAQQYMKGTLVPLVLVLLLLALGNLLAMVWHLSFHARENAENFQAVMTVPKSAELPEVVWKAEETSIDKRLQDFPLETAEQIEKPGNLKAGSAWINGRRVW